MTMQDVTKIITTNKEETTMSKITELYRHVSETVRHPAGTLPALRKLYGGMSVRGGGAKIRTEQMECEVLCVEVIVVC